MTLSTLPSVALPYNSNGIGTYTVDALHSNTDGVQVLEMPLPSKRDVLPTDQWVSSTTSTPLTQQPLQVKVLQTLNNVPSSPEKTLLKKPFKPPALLLVALEAAGLGFLWFTGDYLGKVTHNNDRSTVIGSNTIPFDRIVAEAKALQNALVLLEHRQNGAFVSQVEGNWMAHANALLKLSTDYLNSPKRFYGSVISNNTPKEINTKIYEYLKKGLAFYQRNGHQHHQVQIAKLVLEHKLALPLPEAGADLNHSLKIAQQEFAAINSTPRTLWDEKSLKQFRELTKTTEETNTANFNPATFRTDINALITEAIEQDPKHTKHYTTLLTNLVNLDTGLKIIQDSIRPTELSPAKAMQGLLLAHQDKFLAPYEDTESPLFHKIALAVMLEKMYFLACEFGRPNEAFILNQQLTALFKQPHDKQAKINTDLLTNALIHSDMQLKGSTVKMVDFSLLNQWVLAQLRSLQRGNTDEVKLVEKLISDLHNFEDKNSPEIKAKRFNIIQIFFETTVKVGNSPAGRFTLKILTELLRHNLTDATKLQKLQEAEKRLAAGVFPSSSLRYQPRTQMIDEFSSLFENNPLIP
jgi:hypothetical protein